MEKAWKRLKFVEEKTKKQQKKIDELQTGLNQWRQLYWNLQRKQIRDLGYYSNDVGYSSDEDDDYTSDEDDM